MNSVPHETSFGRFRIVDEGPKDGPVILFIHGVSYPLEVFSLIVQPMIENGFRCVRFDLYGRGESSWKGEELSADFLATQALEVIHNLGITGSVTLVSLSNGDLVANVVATRIPDRITAIAWLAPSGLDRRTNNLLFRLASRIPGFDALVAPFMRWYFSSRMRRHSQALQSRSSTEAVKIYQHSIDCMNARKTVARAATNQLLHQQNPMAVEVSSVGVAAAHIPVLMISFGSETDTVDPDLNILRQHIRATEVTLDGLSHMGLLEEPARIIPHLIQFFS
ncbi:MAG: alpha/beta hydrolase [Myxococcota bacterium]|nr:alpha/beta hydrolase [Myxococcota bacterium]